jgi:hypothetical protein
MRPRPEVPGSVWFERVSNREENRQFRWAVQYPEQRAPPE